ncbi:MAG: CPBP family intramembrane glutamic endopeptidase, partial [Planctomycetota bacterium]
RPVRGSRPGLRGEPAADVGLLEDASVEERARWSSRAALEVALVMAAFWGPALAVLMLTAGEQEVAFMPLTGLVSSLLVLLIGFSAPAYAFGAMRRPRLHHCLEALGAILVLASVGHLYMEGLVALAPELYDPEPLTSVAASGWLTMLFVLAICPGVFEEIAFRGILQARLSALYGLHLGGIYAAVAFGLAHTVTAAIPIHFLLGFYLVWLRIRSDSILPGIVVHIGYNSAVVWLHLTFLGD